MVLGFK